MPAFVQAGRLCLIALAHMQSLNPGRIETLAILSEFVLRSAGFQPAVRKRKVRAGSPRSD
jgi:hypothetical protein